ncbi:MAG: Ig-like domain-containing protein [Myxococcota bacterium]
MFVLTWITLAAPACHKELQPDHTPLRLVQVSPPGFVVGAESPIKLTFSEAVDPESVLPEHAALVKQEDFTPEFAKDFANVKLSEQHEKKRIPAAVVLSDETTLVITPRKPLAGGTAYRLMLSARLRDRSGNPLVGGDGVKVDRSILFRTRPERPRLTQHDLYGTDGPAIYPNRSTFQLTFSQPLAPIPDNGAVLLLRDEHDESDRIDLFQQSTDRKQLTVLLGNLGGGCARLQPAASYQLVLTDKLTGDDGTAMEEHSIPFRTAEQCDPTEHKVLEPAAAVAGETTAVITLTTNKPGTSQVWFGLVGERFDCLGNPCPVTGKPPKQRQVKSEEKDQPPTVQYVHKVELDKLEVGNTYQFVIAATDAGGAAARDYGVFVTEPLPDVAINEVMINPKVEEGGVEWEAEYVELFNHGGAAVDLTDYALAIRDAEGETVRTCPVPSMLNPLQPSSYLVLAGTRFDRTRYPGLGPWQVHLMKGSQVCGTLSNAGMQTIALIDPKGRTVSSYGGHRVDPVEGKSIERVQPDAPDEPNNFCLSPDPTGVTPGRANAVKQENCEQEK